jgi:uncharacterized protein
MDTLIIFIAALLAFSISLICGGGAGLLLIPILGFSLAAAQVPAALSVGTSVSSITKISLFYKNIRWQIVKIFLPAAIPGVLIGAWLLSYLNPMYIELCMAVFLISNLPYLFKKSSTNTYKNALPKFWLGIVGLLAGFISGLTGAVGVLFNRVYFRFGLSKEEIVATRAANEVILHIIKLFLYAWLGLFTLKALQIGVVVAVAAIASTFMMKFILPKISVKLFSKMGYIAMVVAGVLMFNSAVVRIQAAHNPEIELIRMAKGFDTALNWDDLIYTIEFKYGEGFEFEKLIPFSALSTERQALVLAQQPLQTRIVVEKVYSVRKTSYEAYFYNAQNQLVKKVKFK